MLDDDGKPKIVPAERGEIKDALMKAYELVHDQAKEASSQSELLENADVTGYKDVTAIGARIADANMHQRINRRLGGPYGYEQSIAEDAIKLLEIAHQYVPKLSVVAVMEQMDVIEDGLLVRDDDGDPVQAPKEVLRDLPWHEALQAITDGGQLIKLGVDAIVGPELAEFWAHKVPPEQWKLSTKVIVEPGTTRTVTKDQQVAVQKQLYIEVYFPFYEATRRYDLMRDYLEYIGRLSGTPNIEDKLPEKQEAQQIGQQQQEMEQQQMQAEQQAQQAQGEQQAQQAQAQMQQTQIQAQVDAAKAQQELTQGDQDIVAQREKNALEMEKIREQARQVAKPKPAKS
jgi:hypothetical protein